MDGAECWQKRVSGAHAVLWVEFDLYLGEPARDGTGEIKHQKSSLAEYFCARFDKE